MKAIYLGLMSAVCLSYVGVASAEAPTNPAPTQNLATAHFTSEQVGDIKKIITDYLTQNPDVIMLAFQAGMAKKQQEEIAKMEKAVLDNRDKIFKNSHAPTAGNDKNPTQELAVFMDPYCGYCKKFHGELETILSSNKDLKIVFVDIPIMGDASNYAIKAMLAAKLQGKYDQMQQAVFSSDKHLTKKQILKIATSLGMDAKQLEADMKRKDIQAQIDQNAELAKSLGINGTPTLIIGKNTVIPGFLSAEEVTKKLKETSPPVQSDAQPSKEETGTKKEKAS